MASRRTNRFVCQAAPGGGGKDDLAQLGVLKTQWQKEAVFLFKKERNESALLASACNMAESLLRSGQVGCIHT